MRIIGYEKQLSCMVTRKLIRIPISFRTLHMPQVRYQLWYKSAIADSYGVYNSWTTVAREVETRHADRKYLLFTSN